MLNIGDSQEATSDNHSSQASNQPTTVAAFPTTNCNDGSTPVDNLQASSEHHGSGDGLTMIAPAASACDAAEINPSAATAKSRELDAVSAETAESAETYAPQLAIREQGSLSCNMPLSSWTYCIDAYSFSGLSELLKSTSDGKNSLEGIEQIFKTIR